MALFQRKIAPALILFLLFLSLLQLIGFSSVHAASLPPIVISDFIVVANIPWNDTRLDVTEGSSLSFRFVSGGISPTYFGIPNISPTGKSGCIAGETFVVAIIPCYSLVGRIGEGPPFPIGVASDINGVLRAELTLPATGRLYLGVNDEFFADNTASWHFDLVYRVKPPTPTATPTPTPTPSKTPLIFIPGIGGSEFKTSKEVNWSASDGHEGIFTHTYPAGEKVWVNEGEAAKPGDDDYFDVLRMKTDGQTSEADVKLTGNIYSGAYQQAIDFFTTNGYILNQDLFVFPYDWRKDITLTTPLLDQKIEQVKQQTGSQKVDIVAHSMGGLVARNYITDVRRAQKIRKLISVGTPHLGSVEFLKSLRYGGCIKYPLGPFCLTLAPSEMKDVVQNMIGGYELTPTQAYFTFYTGVDNFHPFPFADMRDVDNNGVTGALNYNQIKTLLTNLNHNTSLFIPSETFHTLDSNLGNTNGVNVTNIVGSGKATLGQIIEKYSVNFLGIKIPHRDEIPINGDETVPLFSASLIDPSKNLSMVGSANVFYTNQKHGALVSNGPALDLVKNILNGNNTLPLGVSAQPYGLNGTGLSVHSPVNIHAYDANGNHTGPTADGFEANIPGSSYDTLDDAKFIFLPESGQYTITFEATDQGSFDFKIRKFEDDLISQTILYKDVPLKHSTRATTTFDTQSSQSPVLELDEDGDGVIDTNVGHFSILGGDANYDYTPPRISFDVNPKIIWPANNKMVEINIAGTITDENPYLTTILVDDEYDLVEPSTTSYNLTEINQTIKLEASRRGDDKDGRIYKIKVLATDLAGNTSLSTFEVIVPHDQRDKR